MTLQIGITGGIGTGKSLICRVFALLGVPVYDADTRSKWLLNNDPILKATIIHHFGSEAYLKDGSLNRPYLAKQVFNQGAQVEMLNSIVHPRVGEDYQQWLNQHAQQPYVLKEAALLFEAGSYKMLDKIIVVSCPLPLRLQRIRLRDPQRTEEEIMAIISKQLSEEEKVARADYLLYNDEKQSVLQQVLQLHATLTNRVN